MTLAIPDKELKPKLPHMAYNHTKNGVTKSGSL